MYVIENEMSVAIRGKRQRVFFFFAKKNCRLGLTSPLKDRLSLIGDLSFKKPNARHRGPLATREPPAEGKRGRLGADDHALAAGGALDVSLVVLGGALGRVVAVAAAGAAAVELDAIAGPRDAVALAGAARRPAGHG